MKAAEYKHIRAWGKMLSSHEYYIRDQQERAAADKAPIGAIYKRDGKWVTFEDVQSPDTRAALEKLL